MFCPNWRVRFENKENGQSFSISLNKDTLIETDEFKERMKEVVDRCDSLPDWEWTDKQYIECYLSIGAEVKKLIKSKLESNNVQCYNAESFDEDLVYVRAAYLILQDVNVIYCQTNPAMFQYLKQFRC